MDAKTNHGPLRVRRGAKLSKRDEKVEIKPKSRMLLEDVGEPVGEVELVHVGVPGKPDRSELRDAGMVRVVVRGWYAGGARVVRRWCEGGARVVRGWCMIPPGVSMQRGTLRRLGEPRNRGGDPMHRWGDIHTADIAGV